MAFDRFEEIKEAAGVAMSVVLRDSFAQCALNGMLARSNSSPPAPYSKTPEGYAKAAYAFADAMLKAREGRP